MKRGVDLHNLRYAKAAVIGIVLLFVALKIPAMQSFYMDRDEPLYVWQSLRIYKEPASILLLEINRPYYALFTATAAPLHAFFPPQVPLRIVTMAFALVALFFTYLIGKELFSEKAGLAAIVLMLSSPAFFFYAARGLPSVPLTALSAILIYLLITLNRRRAILAALTLAAMYLIKTTSMVVLPAVAVFLMLKYREKLNKKQIAAGFGLLALLIACAIAFAPGEIVGVILKTFSKQDWDVFFAIVGRGIIWALTGTFTIVFALVGMLELKGRRDSNIALLLLWIVFISAAFALTFRSFVRYYLPIMPAVAVIAGYGFARLAERGLRFVAILAAAGLLFFAWGFYWEAIFWKAPWENLYARGYMPLKQERWSEMGQWFGENVGGEDRLIVLSEQFVARTIVLSAELGLPEASRRLVVNPSRGDFEMLISQAERDCFVVRDSTSPIRPFEQLIWLYADTNAEEYLASMGFEEIKEFPPQDGAFFFKETYFAYKKSKQ